MTQSLILVDALFLPDGGRRREGPKRRENSLKGRRVYPGRPTLLAVSWSWQLGAIKG
jgi:hypothetical protein